MYDPTGRTLVTKDDIVAGLRDMGLRPGHLLQVHSSLSAFGHVDGGAGAVIGGLLETVAPDGTVMMPSFNHGRADVFDINESVCTNGIIPDTFWRRPEARRSMHPTHPYAAIGPLAEFLMSEHLDILTFDARCPLGKLIQLGGHIVLLGCGMRANTAAHVAETMAQVKCMGYRQMPRKIKNERGEVVDAWSVQWRDGKCLIEWDPIEEAMRERDQIRDGQIGDAEIQLMRGADMIGTTFKLTQTICPTCPVRPKPLAEPSGQ
ncbi:MAG: AAC(3) family N-acetyltransferase [Armatimonadota bacterium]